MGRISIISAKDNSLYIHGEAVLSLLISSAIEMEFSLFKKKTDSHLRSLFHSHKNYSERLLRIISPTIIRSKYNYTFLAYADNLYKTETAPTS